MIGPDPMEGAVGYGDNLPEALKELADELYSEVGEERKWLYSFCLWPSSERGTSHEVFQVFEYLKGRIEFEWTSMEFVRYRHALQQFGLEMHEIERVRAQTPETVL